MKFFLEITCVTTNFSWRDALPLKKKKIIKNLDKDIPKHRDILYPVENLRNFRFEKKIMLSR